MTEFFADDWDERTDEEVASCLEEGHCSCYPTYSDCCYCGAECEPEEENNEQN